MMSRAQPQQPRQTLSGPKATRTREGLVNAARDLFPKRGYVETSVDDIAEAAQVSRPTFYAYFHSNATSMEAVGLTAAKAATPVLDALGELGPTWTTEDIAQWVRSYFAYQRVHGPWAIVFRQAITFDPQLKVASAIDSATFRPKDWAASASSRGQRGDRSALCRIDRAGATRDSVGRRQSIGGLGVPGGGCGLQSDRGAHQAWIAELVPADRPPPKQRCDII